MLLFVCFHLFIFQDIVLLQCLDRHETHWVDQCSLQLCHTLACLTSGQITGMSHHDRLHTIEAVNTEDKKCIEKLMFNWKFKSFFNIRAQQTQTDLYSLSWNFKQDRFNNLNIFIYIYIHTHNYLTIPSKIVINIVPNSLYYVTFTWYLELSKIHLSNNSWIYSKMIKYLIKCKSLEWYLNIFIIHYKSLFN